MPTGRIFWAQCCGGGFVSVGESCERIYKPNKQKKWQTQMHFLLLFFHDRWRLILRMQRYEDKTLVPVAMRVRETIKVVCMCVSVCMHAHTGSIWLLYFSNNSSWHYTRSASHLQTTLLEDLLSTWGCMDSLSWEMSPSTFHIYGDS